MTFVYLSLEFCDSRPVQMFTRYDNPDGSRLCA
jgi:hypothetical protein